MKFDSVIFDLDGTLWHTREAALYAWKKTLEKHPYITTVTDEQTVRSTMGKTLLELAAVFLADQPLEKQLAIMQDAIVFTLEHVFASASTVYPGVIETVRALSARLPVYIISDGPKEFLDAFFVLSRLEDCIGGYALLSPQKDKTANLKDIITTNGLGSPLMVGDGSRDAEAARANGVKFCYACYGYLKAEDYDFKIDRPEQLLEIAL